ncbi:family 43 glycosylhydrolase [Microbacterium sp. GXF0217]
MSSTPAAAAETLVTVTHKQITSERGTPNLTYYECPEGEEWDHYSAVSWAPDGCAFEIAFAGHTLELYGNTRSGHGVGEVYVDDVLVGTIDYGASTNGTVRRLFTHGGLTDTDHTLRVVVVGAGVDHASALFKSGAAEPIDPLQRLYAAMEDKVEEDYTASSWPAFADARAAASALLVSGEGTPEEREAARAVLQQASDDLVMIRGLRDIVAGYRTRVPVDFSADSWGPFAQALDAAGAVLEDAGATSGDIVATKNALQATASALLPLSDGSFERITNNTFWTDTDGNPIYSQGGGIFRFGDTYYWYGVRYTGAELYHADPTRKFDQDDTFESIPVYSSKDLVNWTFENEVATKDTRLHIPVEKGVGFSQMETLADASWLGRLGVAYNENTGKYVLPIQVGQSKFPDPDGQSGVLLLQGDSPTDDFAFGNIQRQVENSPTQATGDQTVFTDDDGNDYLVFSNKNGRAKAFVSKLSDSDSLTIEPATQIGSNPEGREGNAMFKLDDTYYMAASALHGWNTSPNYVIESLTDDIQGEYSTEFVLDGTAEDYSHVTQTGFFVTVEGTKQDTVLYAGDRWADFAWNGLGYNQWVPITEEGDDLRFHSVSDWEFNATTGEWRVGPDNNYVLNPEFAADRISVGTLTGWTNHIDDGSVSSTFIGNESPGAGDTRFGLHLGAAEAYSGSASQTVEIPDGVYEFSLSVKTAAGLEHARALITGAEGQEYELDLNRTTDGWETSSIAGLELTGGTATVSIQARGAGGTGISVDALSLRKQTVDRTELQSLVDQNTGRDVEKFTAASWNAFDAALGSATTVLADSKASQSEIDAARESLSAAADSLESAVVAITDIETPTLYAVGAAFDDEKTVVTVVRDDGTSAELPVSQYVVSGFSTGEVGTVDVQFAVAEDLAAVGAELPSESVSISTLRAWSPTDVYKRGDEVIHEGTKWVAGWRTLDQAPGDTTGPWQEHVALPDGDVLWTPSRIFMRGDVVLHEGQYYTAGRRTRDQQPGDANGPWTLSPDQDGE